MDMILMLTTLDSIVWTVNEHIHAFPTEETNPETTNGWGVDVDMPYTIKIEANIKARANDIGKCYVAAKVTFANPYEKKDEIIICRELAIDLSFMRGVEWEEFFTTLQTLILNRDFWRRRKNECEEYLLRNAPTTAIPDPDLPM